MHYNYCDANSLGQCKRWLGIKYTVGNSHTAQNLLLLFSVETISGPRAGSHPARLSEKQKRTHYSSFLFEKCLTLVMPAVHATLKSLSSEAADFPKPCSNEKPKL